MTNEKQAEFFKKLADLMDEYKLTHIHISNDAMSIWFSDGDFGDETDLIGDYKTAPTINSSLFRKLANDLKDDETPIKPENKPPSNNNVQQSVMLCKEPDYHKFLHNLHSKMWFCNLNAMDGSQNDECAKLCMYEILEIKSRREVKEGDAAKIFHRHVGDFNAWRRGEF